MAGRMKETSWDQILLRINMIRDDHHSGATALTREAAGALIMIEALEPDGRAELIEALETACRLLIEAQPSMAPLVNLANAALQVCEPTGAEDPSLLLGATVSRFLTDMEESTRIIAAKGASLIKDGMTVLTHSSSEAVRRAVVQAHSEGRGIRMVCTESRPVCEGVALAKSLGEAGIPVTLIVDAAISTVLSKVDVVLVGADAVTPDFVVNKAGTSVLALAAKEAGRRMYALAGSEKFLPAGYHIPAEVPKDPAEVYGQAIAGVEIRNIYFDRTPIESLAGLVTRDGVLNPPSLRQRLSAISLHSILR